MFSQKYLESVERVAQAIHFAAEDTAKEPVTHGELAELAEKSKSEPLTLVELARVSQVDDVGFLENMLKGTFSPDGGEVNYIAPTFQTNSCIDVCAECGWNRNETTARVFLKPDEFGEQLATLKGAGFGVVEISNGTTPRLTQLGSFRPYLDKVADHIDAANGEAFGICSPIFEPDVFEHVFPAVARFWVQWMETYDLAAYHSVHRFTRKIPDRLQHLSKANFTDRLDSYDRVMALGADVMLGVQYGLSQDPLFDALMTVEHARYLREEYGRDPLCFGTVTNNPHGRSNQKYAERVMGHEFSDEEYRALIAVYKLANPQMGRWLNTRIPMEMVEGAILAGDMYTGECSDMVPGKREGLTALSNREAGQFNVFELAKTQWERRLAKQGLGVNYAWMRT